MKKEQRNMMNFKLISYITIILICSGIAIADQKVINSEDDLTAGSFSNMQLNIEPTNISCNYRYTSSGYDFYTSGQHSCESWCGAGNCDGTGACSYSDFLIVEHTTRNVAPVTKTVTYGTVTTSLSGASKCWITQNLGASQQATSVLDNTEASAGWYWQFNRKQGYKHDGTSRIPSSWNSGKDNTYTGWDPAKDPCTLLLGSGWRLPTRTEWNNIISNGALVYSSDAYDSVLKLHNAGHIYAANGNLGNIGSSGWYQSSTQKDMYNGYFLSNFGTCSVDSSTKASGISMRCLKD